ncbi:hypothetical protein Scep_030627 [Stephania cephalantha]|uniref:Cyclin-like domain-containing protein n=1 Tax=Stephania cephalantha TaxID=152367 RepID=A0AAP0E049_9MAGN
MSKRFKKYAGLLDFHIKSSDAIIYFKRFYPQWSVMEHHPKNIMLTCVYASCKVEENHVSMEELGKGIQQDHQVILNHEMIVFRVLDLIDCICAISFVQGFVDDMEDFMQVRNGQLQMLKDLQEIQVEVDKVMLLDAPLLFPLGQLALAALRRSNEVHRVLDFERYLNSIFSRQQTAHSISELIQSLNAIDNLVSKLKIPTAKDMRHIDRKLKSCLDPSSQDDSKKREKKSKHKSKSSEHHGIPS